MEMFAMVRHAWVYMSPDKLTKKRLGFKYFSGSTTNLLCEGINYGHEKFYKGGPWRQICQWRG